MNERHNTVSIHIDKKHVTSSNPTTGQALYLLGAIPDGYDLYREVPGPSDDELVANDGGAIELKNGDHFFSSKKSMNPGCNEA